MYRHLLTFAVAAVVVSGAHVTAQRTPNTDPPPVRPRVEVDVDIVIGEAGQGQDAHKEQAALQKRIEQYQQRAATLPPADAAREWLALVDAAMPQRGGFQHLNEMGLSEVVAALPPPAAWQEISSQIDARPAGAGGRGAPRQILLRLLGHVLVNDQAAQKQDLASLREAIDALPRRNARFMTRQLGELEAAVIQPDPAGALERFAVDVESASGDEVTYPDTLDIPDLVTLVGREKAEEMLRRAMVVKARLRVTVGDDTAALAREVALELVPRMKVAQWDLVDVKSLELYESLDKQFAQAKQPPEQPGRPRGGGLGRLFRGLLGGDDEAEVDVGIERGASSGFDAYERRSARERYLIGLIAAGRTDDAVRVAREIGAERDRDDDVSVVLSYDAMSQLDRHGHAEELYAVLHKILSENPDLPLWPHFERVAANAGHTQELLKLARDAVARENLNDEHRRQIRERLYRAMLAHDQIDDGVALLRQVAMEAPNSDKAADLGVQLAMLGQLLQRPEWTEQGVEIAIKASQARIAGDDDDDRSFSEYELKAVAEALSELGRHADAIALITRRLDRPRPQRERDEFFMDDFDSRSLLVELAGIHHATGNHEQVLKLLDTDARWGEVDLAKVHDETDSHGVPLGFMAAAALANAGRAEESGTILTTVLHENPGFDAGYQLLLKLTGDDAVARLDALFALDPFQERPLIWKAVALASAGKLDDAEAAARQAIAIDPSDGEQGRGRRMRVYGVLADVLEKKGDAKNAETFREVVKAIRIAEDADRFYAHGLLKRGVEMYRDALKHFADAYCIQSRLAVQLAGLGLHDLAEQHYRRAYELMPDSFGRVESHCFGCEGAFRGARAQSIAEQVFTRFVKARPDKPQVHYLLGYLREQQGRHAEALESFKKAVALDPQYLNAWEKIAGLARNVHIPQADRDEAALNVLRLDPLRRHAQPDLEDVRDLRKLWEVADAALKRVPKAPEQLYPLKASTAAIEKHKAEQAQAGEFGPNRTVVRYISGGREPLSPGQAIAQSKPIAAILELTEVLP